MREKLNINCEQVFVLFKTDIMSWREIEMTKNDYSDC